MVKRLGIIGALMLAPLATAGAQLSCATAPASVSRWPAPLDRQFVLGDGVMSVRDAIERAGAAAKVHFTYQADLLPDKRTVCSGSATMRLGDALVQWLEGSRLKAVVAGEDRVVLALVRAPSPTPASEQAAMTPAQLAPVVVVEHGQEAVRENATVSRTIVTGEQLEATGSATMGQALSGAVPGLWMWTQSPASIGGGMASLRGASSFGASYPKVYVDGIEVANPMFVSQLATDQIAEVEVIRGPQGSALYGAGAIGGVINITTRAAAGMADGRRVSLRSTAGLAESAWSPLGAFVQDHAFNAQLGDDVRSMGLGLSTSTIGAFIPGAFSQMMHASAAAGFVGTKSRLQLTARFFSQRAGNATSPLLPDYMPTLSVTAGSTGKVSGAGPANGSSQGAGGPIPAPRDSTAAQDVTQYTLGGTWAVAADRWTHTLVGGVDGYRLDNVSLMPEQLRTPGDSALLAASGGADRLSMRWSGVSEFGTRAGVSTRLTVGADHSALRDASLGTTIGTLHDELSPIWRFTSGVSTHADVSILRSFTLNGGVRVERNSGFTILSGLAALPSIGAAYRRQVGPAAVTLRTAYGRAISPARVSMRQTSWGGRAPAILSLEPEEQSGIEMGADVAFGSRFSARITRYDQRASNLVQPVAATNGGRGFTYQWQNIGAISNEGWEMESRLAVGRLMLGGSLGLTDSRVGRVAYGYTGDLRAGDRVLQVPRRTMSVTGTWTGRSWTGSTTLSRASDWMNYDWLLLSGDLSDPQMTPPHGAALRAYWREYPGVTRLRAAFTRDVTSAFGLVVSGENLLNAQAGEPDNVTIVPGRTVRAGLRARF